MPRPSFGSNSELKGRWGRLTTQYFRDRWSQYTRMDVNTYYYIASCYTFGHTVTLRSGYWLAVLTCSRPYEIECAVGHIAYKNINCASVAWETTFTILLNPWHVFLLDKSMIEGPGIPSGSRWHFLCTTEDASQLVLGHYFEMIKAIDIKISD